MELSSKFKKFNIQPRKKKFYNEFYNTLFGLINNNSQIIQISGAAGSGKSTLTQFIVGTLVDMEETSSVLWINASSGFSNKRLEDIFKSDPQQLSKLKENILVANALSYFDQQMLLNKICSENYIFPPDIKFIVVDSISRNFRLELAKCEDMKVRVKLVNQFFSEQIYPLEMLCARLNAILILVHDSSYNPNLEKNKKFLSNLFERIKSIDIELAHNDCEEKQIYLKYHNIRFSSFYSLTKNGFEFMI